MTTNTVCIFPDTMPKAEVLFPLVQVFEQVVYLRPVQNDSPNAENLSAMCREMVDQGLVLFDCPAPLPENRDRFLQLINDLQQRPDDYAAQLSHLSLAGLSRSKKSESKTSIINTLLKQTGIGDEQAEQQAMVLWQARLLLKLGEIFDREQEELQKNLERISAREQGLLAQLREEDEQPFSLTKSITAAGGRTDGQQRLRLKAWSRLFALGDERTTEASTFITTSRDAFDLLLDHYELSQGLAPQPMLNLLLPGGRPNKNFAEQRAAFADEASDLIGTCQRLLETPASITEQARATLDGPESDWANLLEKHYPTVENSRCTLTLSFLPAITVEKLFLETFGRDEDEVQEKTKERGTGAIIGILEEQTANGAVIR